jgi:hypothetical protein
MARIRPSRNGLTTPASVYCLGMVFGGPTPSPTSRESASVRLDALHRLRLCLGVGTLTRRDRYGHDLEAADAGEIGGITGIERQAVRGCDRGEHRVVGTSTGLRAARRSDAATRPKARAASASNGTGSKSASACWACRAARSSSVETTGGPTDNSASVTAVISGSTGEECGVSHSRQQDHGIRVQDASLRLRCRYTHSAASVTASISAFSFAGSTEGSRRHLASSVAAEMGRRRRGRNSAIASPSRVTVSASPRTTRCRTSAPWFRSSLTVTSLIP